MSQLSWHSFLITLQFITRLPINKLLPQDESFHEQYHQLWPTTILHFPLAGLLLGLIYFIGTIVVTVFAGDTLVHSAAIAAMLTTFMIWSSGGLHLDGLADMADAWVGGLGDRQKTLDLMKDPTCGPMAVISLLAVVLLRFVACWLIIEQALWSLLILAPLLSRASALAFYRQANYLREQGMGAAFVASAKSTLAGRILSWSIGLSALLLIGYWPGLLAGFAIFYLLRSSSDQRLGGFTGDIAGASVELVEVSILLVGALFI